MIILNVRTWPFPFKALSEGMKTYKDGIPQDRQSGRSKLRSTGHEWRFQFGFRVP